MASFIHFLDFKSLFYSPRQPKWLHEFLQMSRNGHCWAELPVISYFFVHCLVRFDLAGFGLFCHCALFLISWRDVFSQVDTNRLIFHAVSRHQDTTKLPDVNCNVALDKCWTKSEVSQLKPCHFTRMFDRSPGRQAVRCANIYAFPDHPQPMSPPIDYRCEDRKEVGELRGDNGAIS